MSPLGIGKSAAFGHSAAKSHHGCPLMTKITKLRCRAMRIPLDVPTAFSQRSVTERHYALVEIEGDDGAKGIGFCYAGNAGGKLVTAAVRELFAAKIIGEDAHRVE